MVVGNPLQLGITSIEMETDPAEIAASNERRAHFKRNADWLKEHASEVFSRYRGKSICIAGQEVFAADHAADAWAMAKAAHPEDKGIYSRYIPLEKGPRICAHQR